MIAFTRDELAILNAAGALPVRICRTAADLVSDDERSDMKKVNELSLEEKTLLKAMRDGQRVLYRATTGKATYSTPGHGEHYVTRQLEQLFDKGLVEIDEIDKAAGWVFYKAKV